MEYRSFAKAYGTKLVKNKEGTSNVPKAGDNVQHGDVNMSTTSCSSDLAVEFDDMIENTTARKSPKASKYVHVSDSYIDVRIKKRKPEESAAIMQIDLMPTKKRVLRKNEGRNPALKRMVIPILAR